MPNTSKATADEGKIKVSYFVMLADGGNDPE
jgi:hypothetical protein